MWDKFEIKNKVVKISDWYEMKEKKDNYYLWAKKKYKSDILIETDKEREVRERKEKAELRNKKMDTILK